MVFDGAQVRASRTLMSGYELELSRVIAAAAAATTPSSLVSIILDISTTSMLHISSMSRG